MKISSHHGKRNTLWIIMLCIINSTPLYDTFAERIDISMNGTLDQCWNILIGPLGTNFSEILIEIHTFVFKKIHLKMSYGKWRPFCLGLSVLIHLSIDVMCSMNYTATLVGLYQTWVGVTKPLSSVPLLLFFFRIIIAVNFWMSRWYLLSVTTA